MLLEERNKESAQLARELGVRRNQLYKWQKEIHVYGEQAFPGQGNRPRISSNTVYFLRTALSVVM